MISHNFKVIPSARCVSAANIICKDFGIFNQDFKFHIAHLECVAF
jgi:hypothetical protein